MLKLRQPFLLIGVLATVIAGFIICADAILENRKPPAKKYVLKYNHVLSASEPFHKGLLNWSKRVFARTKGAAAESVYQKQNLFNTREFVYAQLGKLAVELRIDANQEDLR